MRNDKNNLSTVRKAYDSSASEKKEKKKHNIIPKILCVFAAFFLWLYVMETESPEYEDVISSVTVSFENTAELEASSELSVYNRSGNIVDIKLRGKKSVIDKLTGDDIHAFVDVMDAKKVGSANPLKVSVDLPDGVKLVKVEPSTISVYIDEKDTISVDVTEKLENFLVVAPYALKNVHLEHNTIEIEGPKNKLKQVDSAKVIVDMISNTTSFETQAPIQLFDKYGDIIDDSYISMFVLAMNTKSYVSDMRVSVDIDVSKEIPVKTVFKHGFLNSENATVTVTPATLTVKGDETKFSDMANIFESFVIDEKLIDGSSYTTTFRPQLKTNNGLVIAEEDMEVTLTVELKDPIITKVFNVSNIKVKDAPSDLEHEVMEENVAVILRGTEENISKVKDSDISLEVDLSGFTPESEGIAQCRATVKIKSQSSVWAIEEPYNVQIKLK